MRLGSARHTDSNPLLILKLAGALAPVLEGKAMDGSRA